MRELRGALRTLRRQPGFTLLSVSTMALGTGAVSVFFALVYAVLLAPLPWPESHRLVRITESRQGHAPRVKGTISNGTFNAWHADATSIEALGGWRVVPATVVAGAGEPVRLQTAAVTPSLFRVLRTQPYLGRLFVDDDGVAGGSFPSKDFIILSFGLWREQFGARPDVVGTVLNVSGRPHTVVGVMPEGFAFPDRRTRAWAPWAVASVLGESGVRRVSIFSAIARLRPGVTPEQASAEGTARARTAPDPGLAAVAMFGANGAPDISAIPAVEMMTAEVRPALLMIFAGVVLLLLTATANVASLQLARTASRRREFAIRAAIGAPVGRLTRQLATESTILGVAGGAVGLLLAAVVTRALPAWMPADFPRLDDIALGGPAIVFSAGASLAAGVLCSLLPALQTRRLNVVVALSDGVAASGRFLRSPTMRARTAIMTAQVAVACVLLIGAALLGRSFAALLDADRGYDPRNLLTARLPLPADFPMARRTQLLDAVAARLGAMPGVVSVGYGNALPLVTSGGFRAFKMRPPSNPVGEVDVNSMQRVVSPGYFSALGLRLVAGRLFDDRDGMTARPVVVVNRSFAAAYLGEQPLGSILPNLGMCRGDDDRWDVIGVVEDMRQGGVADPPQPEIFMPYAQVACPSAVPEPIVVVRTSDDPNRHASTLRQVFREEAPGFPLDSLMTMDQRVMETLAKPRLYAVVVASLAVLGMAIAAVGLFGVLSYSVAQRSREISLHIALGARPANVLALLFQQVAIISIAGIGGGLSLSLALTRLLDAVLYGIAPHDPVSFLVVPALVALMVVVATIIPAVRAMRIDPVRTLRAT
jgi:putative ABC transport system permease protein